MVKNRHLMALLFLSLAPLGSVKTADDVFDSNGVKIRYVTEGKGEPIVLLHGWMADSSMWGRLDTNPATKEYQLIGGRFARALPIRRSDDRSRRAFVQ